MAQAKNGDTVAVHYTGTLTDGSEFDSSKGREPLEFTIGAGQVIPGFEQAVLGLQPGETRETNIPSEQAYGPRDEEMIFDVDREQLPGGMVPKLGEQYQMRQPDGGTVVVSVSDVTLEQITLDANHPLAGQDLTFDIELVAIK